MARKSSPKSRNVSRTPNSAPEKSLQSTDLGTSPETQTVTAANVGELHVDPGTVGTLQHKPIEAPAPTLSKVAVEEFIATWGKAPKKVMLAMSGGMDSVTLAYLAQATQWESTNVSFLYPSKHNVYEKAALRALSRHYGIETNYVYVGEILNTVEELAKKAGGKPSALMRGGPKLPEGHYRAENMRQTVVPGRNLLFASIMAATAEAGGYDEIWLGIHSGDHEIYPDCRPAWFQAVRAVVTEQTRGKVSVQAPFLEMDKTTILPIGFALGVPYHRTRTCYSDGPTACGRCGACCERLEAFAKNGVEDPLVYHDREFWKNPKSND
jgi:7-cyano-7-deazaguanine synthase